MSLGHTSASSTDNEEHRSVNGNNVKAVAPYSFDGFNLIPSTSDTTALQVDTTSTAGTIYVGIAPVGTTLSAASWQIQSITTSGGVGITWANGSNAFNQIWNNRTSLSYS